MLFPKYSTSIMLSNLSDVHPLRGIKESLIYYIHLRIHQDRKESRVLEKDNQLIVMYLYKHFWNKILYSLNKLNTK